MKRILSTIIVVMLCVSMLSGCELGDKLTAFGLYSRAAKALRDAGGYEIDCTVTMGFDILDLNGLDLALKMNMKQNGDDSAVVTGLGNEVIMSTVRIGEDIYVYTDGTKLRYTLEDTESSENEPISAMPELTKELLSAVEVIKNEDGTKSIYLKLEGEETMKFIGDVAGDSLGGEDVSFNSADLTMNFDEHNDLSGIVLVCDVSYNILGFSVDGKINADYAFVNFGTAPEILPPEDAESYEYAGVYEES